MSSAIYLQLSYVYSAYNIFAVTGTTGTLQGSGDLPTYGSHTEQNIVRISLFLDDLLMFYQALGVNLMRYVCYWRGLRVY